MSEKEINWLIPGIILSSVLICCESLSGLWAKAPVMLKYLQAHNITPSVARELIGRKRAFIPFISPAALGGFINLALPLSIVYASEHYKDTHIPLFIRPPQNSFLLTPAVLLLFVLVLTKSIGALMSLFLSSIIVLICLNKNRKTLALACIVSLFLIILSILIVRLYSFGYWRNPIFSLQERYQFWRNTIKVIKLRPGLGIGPGNLPFVGSWFSHNSFLQLWAESGILGLLSFIVLLWQGLFGNLNKAYLSDNKKRCLAIGLLGFLIHNLVDFTFFLPEVTVFWWVMFALFV